MSLAYSLLIILILGQLVFISAFAQSGDSPFERNFADVKFLDAYFGTADEKIEVQPGDKNVPFTVVLANVGSQDIAGIRGQLSLPFGFTSADGEDSLIFANNDDNAEAGDNFALTFFVNIGKDIEMKQYPGTIRADYSRLRESGVRNSFFDFNFKVTGNSILNMKAVNPFLVSIKNNPVVVELSNPGTAPLSGVRIVLQNTINTISTTSQSVTNVENVIFDKSNWDIGNIEPKSSKFFTFNVYIPEYLRNAALHTPMEVTYFDAHGEKRTLTRNVDFYVSGLIETLIYDVQVRELANKQLVTGEILNEGNTNGLFAFVTLEPRGNSNIKAKTQFVDELEPDSPVPFNIPIEFDGEPRVGEHDIRIIVRYKDPLRNEQIITHDTTITYNKLENTKSDLETLQLAILPVAVGIGIFVFTRLKKRKQIVKQTS